MLSSVPARTRRRLSETSEKKLTSVIVFILSGCEIAVSISHHCIKVKQNIFNSSKFNIINFFDSGIGCLLIHIPFSDRRTYSTPVRLSGILSFESAAGEYSLPARAVRCDSQEKPSSSEHPDECGSSLPTLPYSA